jgi:hypothetical protein
VHERASVHGSAITLARYSTIAHRGINFSRVNLFHRDTSLTIGNTRFTGISVFSRANAHITNLNGIAVFVRATSHWDSRRAREKKPTEMECEGLGFHLLHVAIAKSFASGHLLPNRTWGLRVH